MSNKACVLLDTSFFIRLLNKNDVLHENAKAYYKYFLEEEMPMVCSTISIAEYCVKGEKTDLPFENLRILPFNINHSERAGKIARSVLEIRKQEIFENYERAIVLNDLKLFSQADVESNIRFFITSDNKCRTPYQIANKSLNLNFEIVTIYTPCHESFGRLTF